MKEFSIMLGVLVLWIALNRWVLPWFGIQTCMSGGCSTSYCAPQTVPSCCSPQDDQTTNQNDTDVSKPEGYRQ